MIGSLLFLYKVCECLSHDESIWEWQDLKFKILIKNKKQRPQSKGEDVTETDIEESAEEEDEDEEEEEEEDEEEKSKAKVKFWSPTKTQKGPKKKVSQIKEQCSLRRKHWIRRVCTFNWW